MKSMKFAVLFFSALVSFTVVADECTNTCEEEYKSCKEVAESATAKQACEDDLKSCKDDCNS
jgi:hypothetical protein